MENKDFYRETFSQIRSSAKIDWEKAQRRTARGTASRKVVAIAAVVCLLTAIATAALVTHLTNLKELELTDEITVQQPDGSEVTVEVPTGRISLQGFGEMSEKLAVEEWHRFLENYDYLSVLAELGNAPTGFEERYGCYRVYTQEMADKLEGIAAMYGLKLHNSVLYSLGTGDRLCQQVGGDFLGRNTAGGAYMYEDGTFKFDGQIDLDGYGILEYQFMRCVYGTLTDVVLNIGDASEYAQWSYISRSGIPVTLALAEHKALLVADLSDSFVTISVLAGTATPLSDEFLCGPLSASDLEQFADSFDFTILTPVQTPRIEQE